MPPLRRGVHDHYTGMGIAFGELGSEDGFDGGGSGVRAVCEERGVIVLLSEEVV